MTLQTTELLNMMTWCLHGNGHLLWTKR